LSFLGGIFPKYETTYERENQKDEVRDRNSAVNCVGVGREKKNYLFITSIDGDAVDVVSRRKQKRKPHYGTM